jgi:3-isopropylmalate dehydratase
MKSRHRCVTQRLWLTWPPNPSKKAELILFTPQQAFEGLRLNGRQVRRSDLTLATSDHNVPTTSRKDMDESSYIRDAESRLQCRTLKQNAKQHRIRYFDLRSANQGIVHVIGPELGFTLPGMTMVCGDSHTSTHGAFGALAFGIGG